MSNIKVQNIEIKGDQIDSEWRKSFYQTLISPLIKTKDESELFRESELLLRRLKIQFLYYLLEKGFFIIYLWL